jgi:phage shock protein A
MPAIVSIQSEFDRLKQERGLLLERARELEKRCAELAAQIEEIHDRAKAAIESEKLLKQ